MAQGIKLGALYYEITGQAEGLFQSLEEGGRRVEKLSNLIATKPKIAAAAASAAILAIGIAAGKMALDVQREGQKLGDTFPRVATQVKVLSNQFGVAQTEVLKLYKVMQDRGTRGPEALNAAATAALQLNQALRGTPEALEGVGTALGDVRDLFNIDAGDSGSLAALLFSMTEGRVPLPEFVADLQSAAPIIRQYGLSLNEVGPALIAFREEGLTTSKQVSTALREALVRGGGQLEGFADHAVTAAYAAKKFADQLAKTGEESGNAAARMKEGLNNSLIELGQRILPIAANAMQNLVTLWDHLSGRSSAFDSLENLQAMARNEGNLNSLQRRVGAEGSFKNLQEQIRDGDFSLGELGRGQLEALRRSLQELERLVGPEQRTAMAKMRQEINKLLAAPAGGGGDVGNSRGRGTGDTALELLRAQLAALTGTLGDTTISRLQALQRQVEGMIEALGTEPNPAALARLQALAAEIQTDLGAQREFQKELDQANARGGQIKDRARAETAKEASQLADALHQVKDRAGQASQQTQAIARTIEQAVEGALDLANAFGLVDDTTKELLSNIGQVAAGIGPLMDAIDKVKSKEGSQFGNQANLIATALPVLGGIAQLAGALFGDSPAEKARRAAMEQNTQAIERLTQEVGNLGLPGVTGSQFAAGRNVAGQFDSLLELKQAGVLNRAEQAQYEAELRRRGVSEDMIRRMVNPGTRVEGDQLEAQLKAQGTSRQELQDLADSLGLQVNFFANTAQGIADAFKALNEALAQVELTRFAQTFEGQMQAFQASLNLFDITSPLEKLTRLMQVLQSNVGSPALTAALAGLDVTTAQGRAEADRRLQDLFSQLITGTLDPAALGGLTGDEFLAMLQQLEDLIDQVGAGADQGQSQSWVVNRSITEIRGQRLEAAMGTVALYAQETAENTALMADLLSRFAIAGGLLVPPAPGGDGSYLGGGGGIVIEQLIIQVPAGADPQLAGQQAAGAFLDTLDAGFGGRAVVRTQWGGTA